MNKALFITFSTGVRHNPSITQIEFFSDDIWDLFCDMHLKGRFRAISYEQFEQPYFYD